jgi:hypothetical protein
MMQMAQMAQPALQGAQAVNQLSQAGANIPAGVEGAQALQDNIDPEQAQAMLEQVGGLAQ